MYNYVLTQSAYILPMLEPIPKTETPVHSPRYKQEL